MVRVRTSFVGRSGFSKLWENPCENSRASVVQICGRGGERSSGMLKMLPSNTEANEGPKEYFPGSLRVSTTLER